MAECAKLLEFFMKHKDAAPFLEPVRWEEWGLHDYPKVIKQPMDLGLVMKNLEAGKYDSPLEFEKDVALIWDNCMTYNADGSEYFEIAKRLKKLFQQKFSKIAASAGIRTDEHRAPTLAEKKTFSHNIYHITADELGKVVQILDQRCDSCIRKIDSDDIEIDIDAISAETFWEVDAFVSNVIAASKSKGAKRSR
ncbi:hypothetical protein FNF28_00505 [Cafeteria roenbergensis]|nr:hypothetical protein FNF28_00505 [Cafeteria roenbergensis]